MAVKFDNLEDVNGKFAGTLCYYDKKTVLVKTALPPAFGEPPVFNIQAAHLGGRYKIFPVDDPAFQYTNFNIGYANIGGISPWFYRKPTRQYQQGIKRQQLGVKFSQKGIIGLEENFGFSKPYASMLENVYPELDVCAAMLTDKKVSNIAFHRNFALGWDELHEDFVLEYQGTKIGVSLNKKLTKYRLITDALHLHEALEEALP